MRVVLNTGPLLFPQKTGIGYYVHNLYEGLSARSDLVLTPTVTPGSTRVFHGLSAVSARLRSVFGEPYNKVARFVGDRVITLMSRGGSAGPPDIYHETYYDAPEGSYRSLVLNIYDLSYLRFPDLLPREVVERARGGLVNVPLADRVIVNTDFIAEEVVEHLRVPRERVDVIPLAPSGAYATGDEHEDRTTLRGIVEGPYVLYVGTVEPRKGIPLLIDAFARIHASWPDLRLVIAGGMGWDYDAIAEQPERLGIAGNVSFTGYVDERTLGALYRRALVFVYPSTYEGFGIPVLEAMACGTPVVVSDIPPLLETVGDGGITFHSGDADALAGTLETLLRSDAERERLREAGRARAASYSWNRVISETLVTYRKALSS